ncbi:MAG: hypothetical protein N3C63_09480 [Rhodocyclaceae bacterium]|nr:hypothetical protein [Rhodocyclaceae bacterium]
MLPLATASLIAQRRWLLLAFLASLHLVLFAGPASPLGRVLFLSHIGVGLLWQPFVQPRRRLGFKGTALVVFTATFLAYHLNWGLLTLWLMLLTGVIGGKVFLFPNRWERIFYLWALGYLATALLAFVLPQSLAGLTLTEDAALDALILYASPAVFVVMALLPAERSAIGTHAEIVDYVYGVLTFLLMAVIVLASLALSLLWQAGYYAALTSSLVLIAATLLLLGFIWNPRAGFGGLGSAVAQHVMSLGLPFEDWLESLAALSRREEDAARFLSLACADLPQRLAGIQGGLCSSAEGEFRFGESSRHAAVFSHGGIRMTLFTRVQPSPSLMWYYDLAVRLLAEFHLGKWRAQELRRLSYIEAIHETGARLTHDVKNLLQSLDALCAAIAREGEAPSPRFAELLRRQLPEIAARLRQTLAKLAAPASLADEPPVPATDWLASLANRFAGDWLVIEAAAAPAAALVLPAMFSSIAENLLQNVANKRRDQPGITARLRLFEHERGPILEVEDDGAAIPSDIAARLFVQRVPSAHGLGIGLYQCARLAEEHGYRLSLVDNRAGSVRFRLAPQEALEAPLRPSKG